MPPHQSNNENLDSLTEPLLLLSSQEEEEEEEEQNNNNDHNNDCNRGRNLDIPVASCDGDDNNDTVDTNNNDNDFCIKQEIYDMLSLGVPLAVSFFCRMGMASTDSAFVGHIHDGIHSPETYLAAAVLSDMVLNLCITPPLAFNQVLNGLVSQAMGSNNPQMAGIWLQQSMFWLCITMLPCLLGLLYVEPILILLGFPSDIAYVAGIYAKYNMIWPIPNGWYQCMRFYFQARGLPKPAMYNNIIFFFINAILNYIFVFGGPSWFISSWKGFGFIGAAISLSISRTMQGVCYYIYMFVYQKHHLQAWPAQGWCWSNTFTKDRTTEFMKQSLPNIGTLLFQAFASQTTTVLVGRLGELSIAASSALSTITIPWSGTLSATCCTVSGVRVGYHLGRGNDYAAKQSSMLVMYFITGMNCIMAIFFLVPYFKNRILTIATDDENVVSMVSNKFVLIVVSELVLSYRIVFVYRHSSFIESSARHHRFVFSSFFVHKSSS
jgi:MATE family multidrug resistance protein